MSAAGETEGRGRGAVFGGGIGVSGSWDFAFSGFATLGSGFLVSWASGAGFVGRVVVVCTVASGMAFGSGSRGGLVGHPPPMPLPQSVCRQRSS